MLEFKAKLEFEEIKKKTDRSVKYKDIAIKYLKSLK